MSYIGNPIISTDFPKDTFSGNGSTTAFTMQIAPASVNSVIVVVSGITQDPSTYTISGTTLTFSAAPPTGTSNISVRHLGVAGTPNTPSAGSVVTASIADANVTQAKLASGVAGTGPAISVYRGTSDQNFSQNTWTKVQLNLENFDTNNCFDTSTYRFTPTVAGYYHISGNVSLGGPAYTAFYVQVYKNGSGFGQYNAVDMASGSYNTFIGSINTLVYANGTTDYFELYTYSSSSGPYVNAGGNGPTLFTAFLARAA